MLSFTNIHNWPELTSSPAVVIQHSPKTFVAAPRGQMRTGWYDGGRPRVTAGSSSNQRPYINRNNGWNNYRPWRYQQPIRKSNNNPNTPARNRVQCQDPDFTHKVRSFLFTIDVDSLYTKIDTQDDIQAIKNLLYLFIFEEEEFVMFLYILTSIIPL